jgi:CMP-N-acetylneuraminic acid synthetase
MRWAEQHGHHFDALGLLEPTSPFTKPAWLDDAVERLFSDPIADGIVAVRSVHPSSYYVQPKGRYLSEVAKRIHASGTLRRQEELEEVTPSGNFYISKWERLKESKSLYTETTLMYHVPDPYGLEIDRPLDWAWAEFLLQHKLVERGELGIEREPKG